MNLKELSAHLGLSQTTVSRSLNGYPEVAERTRERVKAAARQFGYQPSTQAQRLAFGKSNTIAHVLPITDQTEMMNPIFGDFIAGTGEALQPLGYDMLISVFPPGTEQSAYHDLAKRGIVDGVIVHGPMMNDPRIPLLNAMNFPFVVHGRATGVEEPYCWLDVNNRSAFREATEYLISLGHRRIALVNGPEGLEFADRRRGGWADAMKDAGLYPDPALTRHDVMTESFGWKSACDLLEQDLPPTAILVSSIMSAIGVRRALHDRGLTMGREVSVVTFDDQLSYFENDPNAPTFTAMTSSIRRAGTLIAQMLTARIQDPTAPPTERILDAKLVIGQSTGPCP